MANLISRGDAYVLFQKMGENFAVRIWNAQKGSDRRLTLPFTPISSEAQPLESEARKTAFDCDAVDTVETVGSGFLFHGKGNNWRCALKVPTTDELKDLLMSQPTLLVEVPASGNTPRQTASVELALSGNKPSINETNILTDLARRVREACSEVGHVRAKDTKLTEENPTVFWHGPRPENKACKMAALAWRPNSIPYTQTFVGAPEPVELLAAKLLENKLRILPGSRLMLRELLKDRGIIVSDADAAPPKLVLAPYGSEPMTRTVKRITEEWNTGGLEKLRPTVGYQGIASKRFGFVLPSIHRCSRCRRRGWGMPAIFRGPLQSAPGMRSGAGVRRFLRWSWRALH